ncbi:MAG: protein kinase [Planctomycetes bacterium]|nr:protein kinase [Planctomycetota bacterium]
MPKLVCQSGPTAGHEYPLTKDVTILGRQSACDVQIHDTMSSRAHCQVRRDGKLFSLVDLGSRNGTLLNGKKVSERQLSFGDRIAVGHAEYLFVKEAGDVELKDLLSKYEILEKIGEGGMGIVYKANQRSMARVVALKILSPKYISKPKFVDQFTREARAAGSLNHPNIIQVHDVGTENEIHYFSMEFVDGPTCMQVLKQQGPFPVNDALEIIRQTAKALEYAHAHRLIHQDIKPDNIMVGPNNIVKLADLGISKTFDEVEADEAVKKVMGTPHYMAPEAALGKKIDQRVDLYSLGATAYHLLTGKTPFSGSSPTEVLKHHVMDPLPPISEHNASVPDNVVALIERMMAKKPEDRYQSATEVLEEIRRIGAGEGMGTERIGGGETMILRRYAKDGFAAASVPTPGGGTTGSRTPGAENTTPEGSNSISDDPGVRTLNRIIRVAIVGVIALIVIFIANSLLSGPPAPPQSVTAPPVSQNPTKNPVDPLPEDPAPAAAAEAAAAAQAKAAAELAALEDRIAKEGDAADTTKLTKELERITDESLNASNLDRAKKVGERIEALITRKRSQQVVAAYASLTKDVGKLVDERDYDNALSRLDAFPDRRNPAVKPSFDKLRSSVEQSKTQYLTELSQRIVDLSGQKDGPGLKQLRDSLPSALLGTGVEQDIIKAMKTIDDERQAQFQTIAAAAAKDLVSWRFAELENRCKNSRPAMGASPAGTQLDQYREAAQKLSALVATVGPKLAARKIRFRGNLLGSEDPDMTNGSLEQGLELTVESGGHLEIKWSSIPVEDLATIATLVLGKDAETYKPAISTLAAAKGK